MDPPPPPPDDDSDDPDEEDPDDKGEDPPPPDAVENLEAGPVGGFMQVRWDPIGRDDLVGYRVLKRTDLADTYAPVRFITSGETSWDDPRFVAGSVQYRVDAEYEHNEAVVETEVLTYPPPTVEITGLGLDGTVDLTWNATPFYGAFQEYVLERAPAGTEKFEPVTTLTTATDTLFTDPDGPLLGAAPVSYRVRIATGQSDFETGPENTIGIGTYVGPLSSPEVLSEGAVLISGSRSENTGLRRLDTATLATTAERADLLTGFVAEEAGFVLSVLDQRDAPDVFLQLDPFTLATQEAETVNEYLNRNDQDYRASRVTLGANGVAAFSVTWYISPRTYQEGYYVHDFAADRRLRRYGAETSAGSSPAVSESGQRLIVEGPKRLYDVLPSGSIIYRNSLESLSGAGPYFLDRGEQLATTQGNLLTIYDTETLSRITSFGIPPYTSYPRTDPTTGYVWVNSSVQLGIYDAATGEAILLLDTATRPYLAGGLLLTESGYALHLEDALALAGDRRGLVLPPR